MKQFKYFTSGVTYRVPIEEDGTLGTPEILKKWTSETYAPKKKPKPAKKEKVEPQAEAKKVVW